MQRRWGGVLRMSGLVAIGMVVGAVCGAGSLVLLYTIHGWPKDYVPDVLGFTATMAAMLGGLLALVVESILLPEVPMGRAIAWSALGAFVGGTLGLLIMDLGPGLILAPIVGAILGLGGMLWWLRRRVQRQPPTMPD